MVLLQFSTGLAAACALVVAGCASRAAPEDCGKACEHVAGLRLAGFKTQKTVAVHEVEESVERVEAEAKTTLATYAQDSAAGGPRVDPPKGLSAAKLAEWRKEVLRRDAEVKLQRDSAIARTKEFLASEQKRLEELKKTTSAEIQKTVAEAVQSCAAACLGERRSKKDVECLLRTQAVEDVDHCG